MPSPALIFVSLSRVIDLALGYLVFWSE
jgi:hypothetical protein